MSTAGLEDDELRGDDSDWEGEASTEERRVFSGQRSVNGKK